ncbi:MAG: inorganic phosphate transporter [Chitinophagaceae bacterium]|nr:inorganic phosphate transporter [Chitinophagaceae bacterium]
MQLDITHIMLIFGIITIIAYDFTNGFHDAADMIATAIASNTMTPRSAILIVTVFTFLGPLLGGVAVADTIGEFVNISKVSSNIAQAVAISAILAAVTFNVITWKLGLPSSSSISLASGLIGAGLYAIGNSHINWGFTALQNGHLEGFIKIVIGMLFSPLAGFIVGFFLIKIMLKAMKRLTIKSKKPLVATQYITVAWLAFSHGTNDAQKGMGMMAMLLLASGFHSSFHVPLWVIFTCASSITLGTLFGGWNIIKTVGYGIYKVKLIHSLADQIGSAFIIISSSLIGAPTSTTQVVTTTLMGIGAGERPHHVRWSMAKTIAKGWLLNIPSCILIGAVYCFILLKLIH